MITMIKIMIATITINDDTIVITIVTTTITINDDNYINNNNNNQQLQSRVGFIPRTSDVRRQLRCSHYCFANFNSLLHIFSHADSSGSDCDSVVSVWRTPSILLIGVGSVFLTTPRMISPSSSCSGPASTMSST